jgi:hypothetical protein
MRSGYELYLGHCAICHGLDGRGQGPLAQAMKIVPADLTQISAKHAGSFPEAKVADVIRNGGAVLAMARGRCFPGAFTSANGTNLRWARRALKRWSDISSRCRKPNPLGRDNSPGEISAGSQQGGRGRQADP